MCSIKINARALTGQSAMVYCASKLMEKIARLLNYCIKAIDHKFQCFIGMINHFGCWKNTRRIRKNIRLLLVIHEFCECSTNNPRDLSTIETCGLLLN